MTEDRKNKTGAARRDDWKTEPMPMQHETFVLNRSFSDEEMEALRRGNIPQVMEDKWFWYMEGSVLWAHRSWTGFCIYRIDYKEDQHHIVTVNRDPDRYACTSTEEDRESLIGINEQIMDIGIHYAVIHCAYQADQFIFIPCGENSLEIFHGYDEFVREMSRRPFY